MLCWLPAIQAESTVSVGADLFLQNPQYVSLLKGKRIGLVTNHTAVNRDLLPTWALLKKHAKEHGFTLAALFGPEHGITGDTPAEIKIEDQVDPDGVPIYSLYGTTRRPTQEMLRKIDLFIYDIQDIGVRPYTYITTLFYVMEEAAKANIPVMVLDRPNPINGCVIDGPMLEETWRSYVGYVNVPYCHGMTVGELARYFNAEANIGCKLTVVPMKGWKREMSFADTGLAWIPTSPQVPDNTTPLYSPITGPLGELSIVNIGVGYTLPFKLVGAPWIKADVFAKKLNSQKFPGVKFLPFHFKPFFGRFAQEQCHGVYILVTDPLCYKPVATQFLILGVLKGLYPVQMMSAIAAMQARKEMFCKVHGTEDVYRILTQDEFIVWKLRALHEKERDVFRQKRLKHLLYR